MHSHRYKGISFVCLGVIVIISYLFSQELLRKEKQLPIRPDCHCTTIQVASKTTLSTTTTPDSVETKDYGRTYLPQSNNRSTSKKNTSITANSSNPAKEKYVQVLFKRILNEVNETLEQLNNEKVRQDDPRLIRIIRDNFVFPPSTEKYNLNNPHKLDYSKGQTPFVDNRLNFMVCIINLY